MEIKYFRLIKTIAEQGSIANSADKLFLTQSALSHQLKELEERIGFKVFLRTRNKWKLTEEGRELYKLGNRILDSLEQGFRNIEQLRAGSAGTIRVSTECYSFYQGVSAFIQKMGVLYPDIEVDLRLEATHQPIPKIRAQEIDLAVVGLDEDVVVGAGAGELHRGGIGQDIDVVVGTSTGVIDRPDRVAAVAGDFDPVVEAGTAEMDVVLVGAKVDGVGGAGPVELDRGL